MAITRPNLTATQLTLALVCLLLTHSAPALAQPATLRPIDLQVSNSDRTIGVDPQSLIFSWTLQPASPKARALRQTAYRILLASSPEKLARNTADIWDSHRLSSTTFWQLPYTGPALHPHTIYFWKAQAWDATNTPGPWSAPARFTTALSIPEDWSAKWIAATPDGSSPPATLPIFRRDFQLQSPIAEALLYVTGLGQYEVHLNGNPITPTVLNPGWTDYRKSIPYDTFDVTPLLHPGSNAFAILLGNGMYNVEPTPGRYTKFTGTFGQPKLILQLEIRYRNGHSERLVSDNTWLTHPGPITFSSIYGGEDFNAPAIPPGWDLPNFPSADWHQAIEVAGPGGSLTPEQSPPIVIAEAYKPIAITTPKPGVTVYDLGQTMSGWPEITVQGPPRSRITLLPGELLAPDGTVTQRSTAATPRDPVLYNYTLRGTSTPETWHPRFTYHSFRYVQVTSTPYNPKSSGAPSQTVPPSEVGSHPLPEVLSLTADFIHANVPTIGTFSSSDDQFNRIHRLIDRAVLSNLASVITDCPSREKLGWLEQTYLNAGTLMLNYGVTGLYEKMSADIAQAQLPTGLVPSIAPEYVAFLDRNGNSNAFRDSPEWGSAIILSPLALYQYTGDTRPLAANYPAMQRYAAYLQSRTRDGLLNYGLGDWYDIGPKPPGPSQLTSLAVTATAVFYEDLLALARIAVLLNRPADAAQYAAQAAHEREAFNQAHFHPATAQYDRGSQTANAVALALGLVPPEQAPAVLDNLVADIHAHNDHVTSGDIGFHYVVRALTDLGRSDVLAAMFSRTDAPSYGFQLARGASTLTEAWDANPESSQNHFMLGHGEEWFYRGLAGLTLDMSRSPDDAITLKPSLLPTLTHAQATHRTPMGLVSIAWTRAPTQTTIDISIPAGARADLLLPSTATWHEGSSDLTHTPGILARNGTQLKLGSGTYHFTTP